MQKTSRASTLRYPRRFLLSGAAVAASVALLSTGACQSGDTGSASTVAPFSTAPTTPTGAGALGPSTTGSTPGSANGTGNTATAEGANTDIALAPSGTAPAGGSAGAPASNGDTSAVAKPCVDSPPPFDPNWPDATCERWATETEECSAAWFASYCDISCGRCTPTGASTGGTAGAPGTADAPPTAPAVDCSGEGLPNVTGGNGYATRYWDCCQTACSQNDGHRCSQDGVTRTGSTQSSCQGGGSFACYDEAPHAISDCLSYGYIAKANPNCGGCYRIQFTGEGYYDANEAGSKLIKGKQMIVKVSNTGSDVAGNQFDLMIPGGGVGLFNACSRQWNTSDLGAQYGGFLTNCTGDHAAKKECVRQDCMKIPAGPARDGCLWFVDWLEVADDPKFTSQATDCPF
jgi:hypothetical protein